MVAVFKDHKQDPEAELDWVFDWGQWLEELETITSASFTTDPGITVVSSSHTTKTAKVWLTGGTEGQVYRITCRVVTSGGRTDDRTFILRSVNR